jgi:hypothetical protein
LQNYEVRNSGFRSNYTMSKENFIIGLLGVAMFSLGLRKPYWRMGGVKI